jgi:hypothetical protein
MYVATQFSVFLINKPGVLAQTLNALAGAKVNILAMTLMDSMEHGVLRVVTSQTEQARQVLGRINAQVTETDVLCLTLSNQPGALAAVATLLSESHININYAYCTAGARGGKTTGILKVADVKKAMKILETSSASRGGEKKSEAFRPSVGRGKR